MLPPSTRVNSPSTSQPVRGVSLSFRMRAGAIFSSGGKLFRVSQDCSGSYGRSVSFHEITSLNPEEYAERAVLTMVPPGGFSGAHTYNFCGRFEVIDAVKHEPQQRVSS